MAQSQFSYSKEVCYEDYSFNGNKPIGTTIGTRYAYKDIDISKTGHTPISASLTNIAATDVTLYACAIQSNSVVRIYLYAAAASAADYYGVIRVMYLKN